jgi:HEAT repeat protein
LAKARPAQAPEQLLAALENPDSPFQGLAARLIAQGSGSEATQQYARALAELPQASQLAMLDALARRGDRAARRDVWAVIDSGDKSVRVAAIEAVQALGTAEDVPRLLKLTNAGDSDIAASARQSLEDLSAEGVDEALAAQLQDASPGERVTLLQLLETRFARDQVAAVLEQTKAAEPTVRATALKVLARLGQTEHLRDAIVAVQEASEANVRAAAEQAVFAICNRVGQQALSIVMDNLDEAEPPLQATLLRALQRIGGKKALKRVVEATNAESDVVRSAATEALRQWDNPAAAPHLLKLARQAESDQQRRLNVRRYIQLAQQVEDPAKQTQMLKQADQLVKDTAGKRQLLSAWAKVPTPEALTQVVGFLSQASVRTEAGIAAVKIGQAIQGSHADQVEEAMQKVLAQVEQQTTRQQAKKLLQKLNGQK